MPPCACHFTRAIPSCPCRCTSPLAQGHNLEYSLLLTHNPAKSVLPFASGWGSEPIRHSNYLVQPSVVRLPPSADANVSVLRCYFRDRRAEHIYTSTSNDDGATWTVPVATSLPNNNAGIHASVLLSGAVAIAFNDMAGETKGDLRNRLAIALSDDGGATFPIQRLLESHSAADHEDNGAVPATAAPSVSGVGPTTCNCYSYPTLAQSADGFIHIAYTWQRRTIKYTRVTEVWIRNSTGQLCQ